MSYYPTHLWENSRWDTLNNSFIEVHREYLYFEFPERGGQLAIRFSKYKAVRMNIKENKNAPWELYDLHDDEVETNNVAARHPEIIKRLDEIVKKEHWPATIREWEFVDPKF